MSMDTVIDRILARFGSGIIGLIIPTPSAEIPHTIKRINTRRGRYISYKSGKSTKTVREEMIETSHAHLVQAGNFKRDWFERNFGKAATNTPCNFTTIGGLFCLLQDAEYLRREGYIYTRA
jgi:hypothetical protein